MLVIYHFDCDNMLSLCLTFPSHWLDEDLAVIALSRRMSCGEIELSFVSVGEILVGHWL